LCERLETKLGYAMCKEQSPFHVIFTFSLALVPFMCLDQERGVEEKVNFVYKYFN
jgi:hypothetical protein